MTLKLKLSLLASVMLSLLLLCLCTVIYLTVYNRVLHVQEKDLSNQAQTIAQEYASQVSDYGKIGSSFYKWLERYDGNNQRVSVYDSSGRLVRSVGDLARPSVIHISSGDYQPVVTVSQDRNTTFISVIRPVQTDEIPGKTLGYILFVTNFSSVNEFLRLLLFVLVTGSIGAVLMAGGIGYWIASRTLKPIDRLIRVVEGFEANRFDVRVEVPPRNDEIARLSTTFNKMLDRVQKSFAQQTRFVADASHEFRTPLTTIVGYADLLDRWGKSDPSVVQEGILAIRSESIRLCKLADDLLLLAGLEAKKVEVSGNAEVDTLMEDVAKKLLLLYPATELHLELKAHARASITEDHLRQIAINLIGNAFKYTPEGGKVRVFSEKKAGQVFVIIEDSGCGIHEADIPHIFDRFYRTDKSRERENGGNGLGLAIVKELVEAYNGSISIESEVGVGTLMTLSFPIARPL